MMKKVVRKDAIEPFFRQCRRPLRDEKKNTFSIGGLDANRSGVFMGTGNGGLVSYAGAQATHVLSPVKKALDNIPDVGDLPASVPLEFSSRFNPFVVAMTMPNACSAVLSIKYGLAGPSITISTACASGTSAIGLACRAIASGEIDSALAGGAEYLADPYGGISRGFDAAGTLAQSESIPAEANRRWFDPAASQLSATPFPDTTVSACTDNWRQNLLFM